MGTGYTRKDTANNIDDGNVINAADLDLEFDGIQSAFDNSTGHTHDGTAGEGAPIETIGPAQDVVATASALRPKTDNTVDLGTTALEYKDLFLDGTAHIDTLDVDENASITGTLSVTSTSTFSDDVTFTGASYNVVWDKSDNALEFADNAKATFGADSDLQIYHETSTGNSRIVEGGTGHLNIEAANLNLKTPTGENYINCNENGNVLLRYDNAQKLATTSTGISVTDDIDVANNIIMSSDAANISFGADSEIYIKHVHNLGLILENTLTDDNRSFVLNLKSNEDTLTADEQIARINFSTNSTAGGVAAGTQASISVDATGTYSSTVAGSRMEFWTTATNGDNLRALYIDDDQSVHFTGPSANVVLDATNNSLDFPDNFKIMVGNGDDLQIYHDGAGSYIDEVGTGPLKIRTDSFVGIYNTAETETIATFADDGAVRLYHDNSEKFSTTSTGIDFTGDTFNFSGTAQATTLTLSTTNGGASDGPILKLYRNSPNPAADDDIGRIDFNGENSTDGELSYARIDSFIENPTASAEDGRMRMLVESGGTLQSFIDLDASNGGADGRIGFNLGGLDIDVRMSGDTVADLFRLDASTDRIGIGTGSPDTRLHIAFDGNGTKMPLIIANENATAGSTSHKVQLGFGLARDSGTVKNNAGIIEVGKDSAWTSDDSNIDSFMAFKTYTNNNATEKMRINSSGHIGIGTSSPTAPLHLESGGTGSGNPLLKLVNDNGGASTGPELHLIRDSGSPADSDGAGIIRFYADDDAGASSQLGYIYSQIADATAATFGGRLIFAVKAAGTLENAMVLQPDSTVLNEGSTDRHLRVESNANTHMLFVDGSLNRIGINEPNPEQILHIRSDGSADAKIMIENETSPRGNFIGMEGSDNIVIAADEDNLGTDSSIQFRVDSNEVMRIEDNGRVGIFTDGTAQQAAQSELHIVRADASGPARIRLQRTGSNAQGDSIGELQFYNNDGSNDGPNVAAKIAGEAYTAAGSGGRLSFYTHDATEGGEGSSPVRRMVIEGSGRVGINDNAPEAMLHINGGLYSTVPNLLIENGSSTEGDICVDDNEHLQIGGWTGSAFNEKMVLGSTGDVSFKYSTSFQLGRDWAGSYYDGGERHFYIWAGGSGNYTRVSARNNADGSPTWVAFTGGVVKSEIEANGDFMSATNSYGSTSDERLKENITAAGSQWDDIKAVQVKKYSMISDGLDAPDKIGVIAQDLQAAGMGGLVKQHLKVDAEENPILDEDGNQEEFYSVKYSILYMKAIKALQEAMERIETLEAKVTALENS